MPNYPLNELEPIKVSPWKMHFWYWLLTHIAQLKKIIIISLIVIDVLLFGWAAYKFVPIFKDPNLIDRIALQVQQMKPVLPARPDSLVTSTVEIVTEAKGSDLVATINNPNQNAIAKLVTYHFVLDGKLDTPGQFTWLQSGETRHVVAFSDQTFTAADLVIDRIAWQKFKAGDFVPSLGIKVQDILFEPAVGSAYSKVTFTAENQNSFGLRNVNFVIVVLGSAGQTVAVGTVEMNNLMAGEIRAGSFTWYQPVNSGNQPIVEVVSDIFSSSNVLLGE